jgi:hypothetical protein
LNAQIRELPASLEELGRKTAEAPPNKTAARLWKWAVAGSASALLALWSLWVWVIQSGT